MDNPISSGSGPLSSILGSIRLNDVLNALQNGVQAINNASNSITNKISSVVTVSAAAGGSSGQVQYNTGSGFGGFTVGGDATLVSTTGVLTIASNAVTYGKFQTVGSSKLLGNPTGATANVSEISIGAGLAFSGSTLINTISSAATPGVTYLGTVTVVSSQIIDTSTTTNILAANSTTYRSFKLILKNIIVEATSGIHIALLVQSSVGFVTSSYDNVVLSLGGTGSVGSQTFSSAILLTAGSGVSAVSPGVSGHLLASNINNGSSMPAIWNGDFTYPSSLNVGIMQRAMIGGWAVGVNSITGFQIAPSAGSLSSGSSLSAVDVYGFL